MEINNKDFQKLNIRVGIIKGVQKHPKTKDFILLIDTIGADKQLVADLKGSYSMKSLIGKQVVFVQNTEPLIVNGIESIGLLLVTHLKGKKVLVVPEKKVQSGIDVSGLNNKEVRFID